MLLGFFVGPTLGGFIVQHKQWPVVFWWTLAPLGLAILLVAAALEDTYYDRTSEKETIQAAPLSFFRRRLKTLLLGSSKRRESGGMLVSTLSQILRREILVHAANNERKGQENDSTFRNRHLSRRRHRRLLHLHCLRLQHCPLNSLDNLPSDSRRRRRLFFHSISKCRLYATAFEIYQEEHY